MIKLKTREVLEKDLPKFAKNLSKQAGRIGDAATGAVLKILKSRDESDEVSSTDEGEGVEEDASTADDAINAVAVNDDENDEIRRQAKAKERSPSAWRRKEREETGDAAATTTTRHVDDAKKNETVVFAGQSVEKVIEKGIPPMTNDGDKRWWRLLVSDMKTIRSTWKP